MNEPTLPPEEFTERLAREIGALFLNFSGVEHGLALTIAAAMNLSDAQERALVRGMMPRAKVEWLQGFSKRFWNAEYQARFKVLATAAIEVAEFRNNIAHGLIVHNAIGEWHTISFRGQHRFGGDIQKLTPQEVGRHVQMAMETGIALHQFSVDVTEGKAKATSPPAPPTGAG